MQKFIFVWILLVSTSLFLNFSITKEQTAELATDRAETIFSLIKLIRQWSAQHGGVYVPITENTPPNPHLNLDRRDIITRDGKKLTLLNPAYVTRQLAELASQEDIGVRFHLTSLNPIRPKNAADEWETRALRSFEQKEAKYVAEMVEDHDGSFFRYMAPLYVQKACLNCHEQQGYRLDDLRGGISVSLPARTFQNLEFDRLYPLIAMHLIILLIGVIFLLYFERYNRSKNDAELAYIDALTGINNRRSFEKQLRVEWSRAKRRKEPLSIIMIDIDYFKNYNDTHGHQMGDQCLADVANITNNVLKRPGDLLARYGGEEFIAILSTDSEGALGIGNQMQQAVEAAMIENLGSPVSKSLTISVGVATDYPSKELYPDELVARADKALYQAKKGGRNRVVYLNS
ncbi:MAG: diguanylate cyclase [Gammaproteobacteria bacterium]|nr:diguanylate cyclase [Gammaproteobacteria bacterium]